MSDFQFGDVSMLHGLWLLPALAALMAYGARRRRQALRRFVEAGLLARLGDSARTDPARFVLRSSLLLLALGCLVVALARPGWDTVREDVVERGRDVVFLLDVSRSMLAEDLPPNRLERAKLAISDAVDRLEGDRVALAVFAGSTVVKCPLTSDYGFFRMALDDVAAGSVSRGGSLIGDGLRTVLRDVFDGKRSSYRDIVLITDGEDHESYPVEAAAEAGQLEVRLIAVGLGDERVGQRIPVAASGPAGAVDRRFLQYEGREVWSRLDAATLRRMADATPGGRYLNVATGTIDFGEVYRRLVVSAEGREIGTRTLDRLEEKFQIFLALCLALLALEIGLRERAGSGSAARSAALLLGFFVAAGPAAAASVRGLVNEGNEAYRERAYDQALLAYDEALELDPGSVHAALNRASAHYRNGDYAEAAEGYAEAVRQSLERELPALEAAGLHNLGNALYRQAEEVAETDPRQAIEHLVPAARSYLDALRADRGRIDSAHNLELARRFIQRLREQASQQPQSGGQGDSDQQDSSQDGKQDPSEALRDAAEEQRQLADESQKLEQDRQQQRGSDSRESQRQRAQDLADRQQDLNERTEQLAANQDPATKQQVEDAARHQQQAKQDLDRNRPSDAEPSQRQAAEALARASRGQQQDPSQQAEADSPPESAAAGRQAPSPSEREQQMTVDQILAKEKQDRRERQSLQRVGVIAVERDW